MAAITKIDNEALEKVGGGMAAAFGALREDLRTMIPAEVQAKLSVAKSDEDTRRILAENGIDVEAIERKIRTAGIDQAKLSQQELSDDALANIAGGSAEEEAPFVCRCGNSNRSKMTWQYWNYVFASLSSDADYEYVYQCDVCHTYICRRKDGGIDYVDPEPWF